MKKPTISQLKKKADAVFSKFIRQRDKGICFTCGRQADPKYMQAGHYVKRSINSLRYDESNVHCQCPGCNIFQNGNMDEYAIALVGRYGEGILEKLHEKKKELKQWSVQELQDIINHYSEIVYGKTQDEQN